MKRLALIMVLAWIAVVFPVYPLSNAAGETPAGSTGGGNGQETLASLNAKGVRIKGQAFPVTFENWGKVRFVTGIDTRGRHGLSIFMTDDQENVLYTFPLAHQIRWLTCDEVKAVSFLDVDKDGLADVIVIGIYNTGRGGPNVQHFYVATVYFQKGEEFISDPDLDKQINEAYKNRTVDMVLEFVADKFN